MIDVGNGGIIDERSINDTRHINSTTQSLFRPNILIFRPVTLDVIGMDVTV